MSHYTDAELAKIMRDAQAAWVERERAMLVLDGIGPVDPCHDDIRAPQRAMEQANAAWVRAVRAMNVAVRGEDAACDGNVWL